MFPYWQINMISMHFERQTASRCLLFARKYSRQTLSRHYGSSSRDIRSLIATRLRSLSHQIRFHSRLEVPPKTYSTNAADKPARNPSARTDVEEYQLPKRGILAQLPSSWVPYAELIRLQAPAGTVYLFLPCLFSTLLAAPMAEAINAASPAEVAQRIGLFLLGAFIMRGAGCSINDLWDRNLDPHVARTRLRPIARGAIKPRAAMIFTAAQLLAGLAVLLQFPPSCLVWGIPSLLLVVTYPLAKRVTHYPQFILGLTFSWGAIMGFPALGIDLWTDTVAQRAATLLYSSCVCWTVLYDMIYAHMDVRDDAQAGIKSIALRHEANTKSVLTGLAVVQISLLAAAGIASGAGPAFFGLGCTSAAASLGIMIWRVNLQSVSNCWWWFRNGAWLTGSAIAMGLIVDYWDGRRHLEPSSPDA